MVVRLTWRWPPVCDDNTYTSRCTVKVRPQWYHSPWLCVSVIVYNDLQRTAYPHGPTTPGATISAMRRWGRLWHRGISSWPSEKVPQEDLLQAHDSFGFRGQSRWVLMTLPSPLPSASLPGPAPQVRTSYSDSWNVVRPARMSAWIDSVLLGVF